MKSDDKNKATPAATAARSGVSYPLSSVVKKKSIDFLRNSKILTNLDRFSRSPYDQVRSNHIANIAARQGNQLSMGLFYFPVSMYGQK